MLKMEANRFSSKPMQCAAIQMEFHQQKRTECDGPAGPSASDGTLGRTFEEETILKVADGKLDRTLQKTTIPDQSSQETIVQSNNHAAETHDDRAGRSHVDCSGHNGKNGA